MATACGHGCNYCAMKADDIQKSKKSTNVGSSTQAGPFVVASTTPVRSTEVKSRGIMFYWYVALGLANTLILPSTAQEIASFNARTASRDTLLNECLTLQSEMLSERKGFRLVHNIIKKLLEERDNAVAELEKMKRANTGKKALVIDIPSDDEPEECRVKKSRKAMVEDVSDTKQSKVQLAKKEKLTLGGDTA